MADIDVEDILSKLSIGKRVELLAGVDFWHTKGFPEYGVPSLRFSDGPNGVRGPQMFNGVPSACFPCGTALGATWDQKLLLEAGILMGKEGIAKGAHVVLGPCVNMQRSPLGGRGFESLAEDPVLAGLGAAALIQGIQSQGVAAAIKHFVCNDQEHQRGLYNAIVTDRALREIYLRPFQIAVREASPATFMASYNKVNGTHVSENKQLLQNILRDDWGWQGLVMSDWFGTYSTSEAINSGLDLEMPGPSRWRGEMLTHALGSNKVSSYTIEERARQVLNLVKFCAKSRIPENATPTKIDTPETAALLRKLAADSIVLLKNERKALPLSTEKKTVVIGPNAQTAVYCGGGSSSLPAYYAISPFDGIQSKLPSQNIPHAIGAYSHKELPILGPQVKTSTGAAGMQFRAYNEPPALSDRKIADDITLTNTDMLLLDYRCPQIKSDLWYADIEGYLIAERDGEYEIGVCVYGTAKLYVDELLIIDNETSQVQGTAFFGAGTLEKRGTFSVRADVTYHIKVEFGSAPLSKLSDEGVIRFGGGGVRIGGRMKADPEEQIRTAVALANDADQVIICTGLNGDWEGEGCDRSSMDLPGHLNNLITSVASINPNTTVVLQTGTPITMPWLPLVPSVIQAWYGGNECGNAIADVIFGSVNPSGKLPLSFPKRIQDNPAFLNFRSEGGRTLYGEDVYVGYRYYERSDLEVLFPFGFGLSYTSFAFSNLEVNAGDEDLKISLQVKNVGDVAGAEVVQLYVSPDDQSSILRPRKELQGFTKVFLEPGASKDVEIVVRLKDATSFWDENRSMWKSEAGVYGVLVSNSSDVERNGSCVLEGKFERKSTTWWKGL